MLHACHFVYPDLLLFLHCCNKDCFSPTGAVELLIQEENRVVCPGDDIVLHCTVRETSLLRWDVGPQMITCPGGSQTGSLCLGSTHVVYAIVGEVSSSPTNRFVANISSSLTVNNITENTVVSCQSQVARTQDTIRVSGM